MDIPQSIADYKFHKKEENKHKKECEKLRPIVLELLADGEYEGIANEPRMDVKCNDGEFLLFLLQKFGAEKVEELCLVKHVIDLKAIDKIVENGTLHYAEVPESCYSIKKIDVIKVK